MGKLELFRSGLGHFLEGDLRTPVNWICEQILEEEQTIQVVDEHRISPSFLISDHQVLTVQQTNKYFSVLKDSTSTAVRLSFDTEIERLEFGILNSTHVDTITIDLDYPGRDKKKTVEFHNGLYDETLNFVPISQSLDRPVSEVRLDVTDIQTQGTGAGDGVGVTKPLLTLPSARSADQRNPPIFLISVDTWRYDHVNAFQPLLDFLGSDATVPTEPRTQGFFTTPSHASMFTGVQPGDHGHVMSSLGNIEPMPAELTTLGEFLMNQGYRNSGLVSHTRLLPNYGYGRGFHRFELDNKRPSSWMAEEGSARSLVDTIKRWLDEDSHGELSNCFYFLHLFDPHPPFYPPLPNFERSQIDFEAIERFLDDSTMTADDEDYLALLDDGIDVDADVLEEVTTTYREAVKYTGQRLLELFRHLDYHGVLDDSLVIITGDHGYEFGERGFTGAKSLYDANIRQGMIVKPPADASWTVPDRCDTIDILPTIARELGAYVPDQCQGQPWQSKEDDSSQPRITERIREKHYNVAVEIDGIKAIYTYHSDPPTRPTRDQLADGPLREEYYDLSAVRDGLFEDCRDSLDEETKAEFRSTADQFVSSSMNTTAVTSPELQQPTQETEEQLRQLGYK